MLLKKSIFIISLILLVIVGSLVFYLYSGGESEDFQFKTSFKDRSLYIDENKLILDGRSIEEGVQEVENLDWSFDGEYFLLADKNSTRIYSSEDLKLVKEFKSFGRSFFRRDAQEVYLSIKDRDYDIMKYKLETGYLEKVLSNKLSPYQLIDINKEGFNYSLQGEDMSFIFGEEDGLITYLEKPGQYRQLLVDFENVDRETVYKSYGDDIVLDVLDYLKKEDIEDMESILTLIDMSDSFVDREHFSYVELMGQIYLDDIELFVRSLAKREDKLEDIAYALHDLKLYDREDSNISKDLNDIVASKNLTQAERQIGINLITTYGDCGA